MKSDFKTKLIQHMLNKKNGEKGFTLIELLVVIIIIGILAAIALPSFLNQTSKAKQTESKTYIATVLKANQAYYTEKTEYPTDLITLSLGTPTQTDNYTYTNGRTAAGTGTPTRADIVSQSRKETLKSYHGSVYVYSDTTSNQASLTAIFEAISPGTTAVVAPTLAYAAGAVTVTPGASGTDAGASIIVK
jgi:type IV pilus assembly protein PilA